MLLWNEIEILGGRRTWHSQWMFLTVPAARVIKTLQPAHFLNLDRSGVENLWSPTVHCESDTPLWSLRFTKSLRHMSADKCRQPQNINEFVSFWFRFTDIKPSASLESRFKPSCKILWSTDEEHPLYQHFVGSANRKQILGLPKVI